MSGFSVSLCYNRRMADSKQVNVRIKTRQYEALKRIARRRGAKVTAVLRWFAFDGIAADPIEGERMRRSENEGKGQS